ncbi:MAG: hypothetical protein KDH96_00855 [Candidatus Riesia sp.]|nr:hypothetical protein [Candidatus Riesia sp.]
MAIPNENTLDNEEYPVFTTLLKVLSTAGTNAPSWWSVDRDIYLRNTVFKIDFLESAVNTVVLKLFSIPFSVVSKNNSSLLMQQYAESYQELITELLMYDKTLEKFIRSFLTADNGAFIYVDDGKTPNSEPIPENNPPVELRWLDSTLCQRTSNRQFPVIYNHPNGKKYKLHHSRVISLVQSPSTDIKMNNVGMCFASRAMLLAQHLSDIYLYEGEVLGNRSSEEIIYATGAKSKEIDDAFQLADLDSDNAGLARYGKRVYLGLRDSNAKIGKLNLKSLPEQFNKRDDIEITLTLLAMASGGSPNWFYDSVKSGSTKASASESTKMGESKIETWFIRNFTHELEQKILPHFLKVLNKNADIDTTGTRARIKLNLAQKAKQNIDSKVTNVRVERQQMLAREDIDLVTFEDLELADGRTPNGLPIYAFFESDDERLRDLLYFVDNPLDFTNNDPQEMLDLSEDYLKQAQNIALNTLDIEEQRLGVYAMYTLDYVRDEYRNMLTPAKIELNDPNPNNETQQDLTDETDVLSGINEDDVIDNNEDQNNLSKAVNVDQSVFSTRALRNTQRSVRSVCRDYWNNNLSNQDFYAKLHSIFDGNGYNRELISSYVKTLDTFIKNNGRDSGGKLSNIYKISDQFILYKL